MNVLLIAWNDVQRVLRERQNIFWMFISPLIFVIFFGVMFRAQPPSPPSLDLANEDRTDEMARDLEARLTADGVRVRRVQRPVASNLTLVVPAGSTEALARGANVQLTLRAAEEETNAERTIRFSVQKALMAMVLAQPTATGPSKGVEAGSPGPLAVVSRSLDWTPRRITSGFQRSVPAYLVMFVFMTLLISGAGLAEERASGRLRRLMIAPVRRGELVAGKLLGRFAIGWVQILYMLALGVVFRIHWTDHPVVFAAFLTIFALACASLGILLGTLFRDPDKCVNVAVWSVIILSPLGGLWWPLEIVGPTMRRVATVTPTGWAMEAVNSMLAFGAGAREVAPYGAAFAVVFLISLALAARRLRP
jgi:ABC-2 type transport system permease protein